jgi:hypothetical protein
MYSYGVPNIIHFIVYPAYYELLTNVHPRYNCLSGLILTSGERNKEFYGL